MKKFYIIVFSLFIPIQIIFSAIKTQNFLDKKKVHLGDIIKYNIVIEYENNIEFANFDIYEILKDTSGVENFIVYKTESKKLKKSKVQFVSKYTFDLIPLKLGNITINELKLKYINKDTNKENFITIPSVEVEIQPYPKPKGKRFDGDIVDIKDQIWIRNYFLILLFIIIVSGIISYIRYKKKQQQPQILQQQQEIDIKEITLKKLEELWNKNYIDNGLIKEFYLELTEIARWYIGEKYKINALELTTEELFIALKNKVDKKYNLKLKSFLDNADLAKFAKYIPDRTEINRDFEIAKELIV